MLYLCRVKPLRHYLRGFLIAAWAGDKIAEFSFPEISFHFPLRPWFFCKPRVCGEKRLCAPPIASAVGSPPRMRGKDFWHYADNYATGITPAYAGKRRCKAAFCAWFWDHPRMCGEKYLRIAVFVLLLGSPPHVRGKASFFGCSRPGDGITPAYAGKRD